MLFDCWALCLLETVTCTDSVVTQEFRERCISVCTSSAKLRECFHYKCEITFRITFKFAFLNKHQILSTRLDVALRGNSVNKFDCRAFSLFETMTRGSQIETVAILWYAQAWRIRPQQIHNNFLESLGYSKQRWYLLIRFKSRFLS